MRRPSPHLTNPSRAVGNTVTVLLIPNDATSALGPAWAALCGAWASGQWKWQRDTLLSLILTLLIVEVLWSTWRAHLVDIDWKHVLQNLPVPPKTGCASQIPYVTPWSPLGRLASRWTQIRSWLRSRAPAEQRGALLTIPILPPLILVLSAAVSLNMLILSLAALSLILIERHVARRTNMHFALQAGLEIGMSWLAGHVALGGPLTWHSLTLACAYALAYQGALTLGSGCRTWAFALLYGGQSVAVALFALHNEPYGAFIAVVLSLLLVPQLLLLQALRSDSRVRWYVRRVAPFVMVAMAVAAWAV